MHVWEEKMLKGDGDDSSNVGKSSNWAAKSAHSKHAIEVLSNVTSVEDQPPSYFSAVSHEVDEVATREFAKDERVVSIALIFLNLNTLIVLFSCPLPSRSRISPVE